MAHIQRPADHTRLRFLVAPGVVAMLVGFVEFGISAVSGIPAATTIGGTVAGMGVAKIGDYLRVYGNEGELVALTAGGWPTLLGALGLFAGTFYLTLLFDREGHVWALMLGLLLGFVLWGTGWFVRSYVRTRFTEGDRS